MAEDQCRTDLLEEVWKSRGKKEREISLDDSTAMPVEQVLLAAYGRLAKHREVESRNGPTETVHVRVFAEHVVVHGVRSLDDSA